MEKSYRSWGGVSLQLIAALLLILLCIPSKAYAGSEASVSTVVANQLKELDSASEALYRYMQDGDGERAQIEMSKVVQLLVDIPYKGLSSVEGIHALTETVLNTREALARSDHSVEEWRASSSKLRLAIDSLLHKDQALWHQYYRLISNDVDLIIRARAEGSAQEVKSSVQSLNTHYQTIRAAAIIQKDPSLIHQFDSWLSYLQGISTTKKMDAEALKGVLDQGDELVQSLFGKKKTEPVLLPMAGNAHPLRWGLLIGGWIILALMYTGFRNYTTYNEVRSARGMKNTKSWRI
ncbi:sporulation protein YpjB [Paenibacillus shirakamiensis]|uniref:Sporulation protein YpjB n=1 Tax=Paenibacillus shirakamiensis TaxID=1265935 RepID=A0ABS4JCW7_9BACL|nr:sporulation protein YpjB [Paenibacillus shirakamiensis]MBP1999565.1 sporulation protein YpjB [Paenibacillus shirakamiensis]